MISESHTCCCNTSTWPIQMNTGQVLHVFPMSETKERQQGAGKSKTVIWQNAQTKPWSLFWSLLAAFWKGYYKAKAVLPLERREHHVKASSLSHSAAPSRPHPPAQQHHWVGSRGHALKLRIQKMVDGGSLGSALPDCGLILPKSHIAGRGIWYQKRKSHTESRAVVLSYRRS